VEPNPSNPKTNKFAVSALVLGIVAAGFYEFFIPAIAALIVGTLALSEANALKASGIQKTGYGMSLAGVILGGVYLLMGVIAATTSII
jgi:Domain of unknown function (DUF4190)